ncbi:MAG: molecular chaperone HtpG [Acidobacteria bacterium]|nr:molecular chaperone HtpG [Acidobacteriota bacterium]
MANATSESFAFKTEIQELLHLIVHTLYTHQEIFLRELLSNATDALSKVQFESLTNPDLYDKDQPLEIEIEIDNKLKMLTITDTGVGMTRDQLIQQIGTIAHSGTKKFLNEIKNMKDASAPDLIGQFGVGFYSVFMVADYVTLETRSMETDAAAVRWESDGSGSYTLSTSERRRRGTSITLKLKKEFEEFLEESRIKQLINQYSNYLPFPVLLGKERVNQPEALWRKPKADISEDEYNEFYKQITNDYQDPIFVEDIASEAPVQFRALLYVPPRAPVEFAGDEAEHGVKLYAKRVFIQDHCKQLLPRFLRFMRGMVDSEDIPLNVSREMIQNDRNILKINKVITKKVIDALKKLGETDEEAYLKVWGQHGRFIKEGVHSEAELRDKLLPLLRYTTTKSERKPNATLEGYVSRMNDTQKAIYYAVGDSVDQLMRSPQLEYFQKHDIEVILATDPLDDLVFTQLPPFQEKRFINVESGDLDLPKSDDEKADDASLSDSLKQLKDKVRSVLQEQVNEVRFGHHLEKAPCRFYNASGGMSHAVKKMVFQMDGLSIPMKRDLELNPNHPLILALAENKDGEDQEKRIRLLFHLAHLAEGQVFEPQELAELITPYLS